ncbi:MAG TPA: hypothetical protein VFQ67_11775 [Allosphingosinicella sp.]|jgi:hypothetical protein|nr:hypothetical protein [Allosphingosinicella sp.]
MDAPKGRYRVEEKNGRLVVIDTATGAPASPVNSSPAARGAAPRGPGVVDRPPGLVDRYGRLLLALAVRRWDGEGRAIVAWRWEQNGRERRWDAELGPAEQKRFGRALVGVSALPLVVLVSIFAGPVALLLLPVALPATFWGVWAIMRLSRETAGGGGSADG